MPDAPAEEGDAEGACAAASNPSAGPVRPPGSSPSGAAGSWDVPDPDGCEWTSFRDDDIMNQQFGIREEEAEKMPCVGDKARARSSPDFPPPLVPGFSAVETASSGLIHLLRGPNAALAGCRFTEPLAALAAEYQSGSPILQEKIKVLNENFAAIRRTRGDGNCFFRSFMFSYLEHILETQDKAEAERMKTNVEECKKTLQDLGYADFTFEDYFETFIELLDSVIQGEEMSISDEELLQRSRDRSYSDSVVMFFRFVTTGEIRKRSSFFEPFIMGFSNGSGTVDQFCKTSVEPMGEESDHIHIIALSDALGVPIRVVYLDRSSCDTGGTVNVNHHDFIPSNVSGSAAIEGSGRSIADDSVKPFVTLLYRPGHYDVLYPK